MAEVIPYSNALLEFVDPAGRKYLAVCFVGPVRSIGNFAEPMSLEETETAELGLKLSDFKVVLGVPEVLSGNTAEEEAEDLQVVQTGDAPVVGRVGHLPGL